jgi:hypothetical protein
MNKKRLALILGLVFLPILISACAIYVDDTVHHPGTPRPHHPRYCYDCHYQPVWGFDVEDCGYYAFYFGPKGYWYAPRHGKEVYVYKKFNYKKDKEFRTHYEKKWVDDEKRVIIEKNVVKEKPEKASKRREK